MMDFLEYDAINQKLIGDGVSTHIYDAETQEWLRQCQRDQKWQEMGAFACALNLYPDLTVREFNNENVQYFPSQDAAAIHILEMIGVNPNATDTLMALIGDPERVFQHAKQKLQIERLNESVLFRIM